MAEKQQQMTEVRRRHITGTTIILASVAGAIIGGPLVGLMGFTFLATTTLLLVTSPLFLLFSPLLFGAACVLALAILGFAVAGATAVVGVTMVARVARSFTGGRDVEYYGGWVGDKFIESGDSQQRGHDLHEVTIMED